MIVVDTLNFLINSPISIKNSKILSLGNPFIHQGIFQSNILTLENKKKLRSIEKNKQIKFLLEDILGANKIDILDISVDEGADILADFNKPINKINFKYEYDLILDFGTSEHVFNRNVVLENIFKLLKNGGIYIFHLPAGGQLDHGFIQYSPTFMYDFCFANRGILSLLHLSLFNSKLKKGISTLPLYEALDKDYELVVDKNSKKFDINTINLERLTGTSYILFNFLPTVMLLGAIKKNKDSSINHDVIQCIYRNMSLDNFFPTSKRKINKYKMIAKSFLLKLPLPALLKLKFLITISRFIKFWK